MDAIKCTLHEHPHRLRPIINYTPLRSQAWSAYNRSPTGIEKTCRHAKINRCLFWVSSPACAFMSGWEQRKTLQPVINPRESSYTETCFDKTWGPMEKYADSFTSKFIAELFLEREIESDRRPNFYIINLTPINPRLFTNQQSTQSSPNNKQQQIFPKILRPYQKKQELYFLTDFLIGISTCSKITRGTPT